MPPCLRRVAAIPSDPAAWAEVLANAIALGWAWGLWRLQIFGPPGTTLYFIARAFGPGLCLGWALATAVLPLLSIAIGARPLRLASTFVCGMTWSVLMVVSADAGVWISPAMVTAGMCLLALMRSQVAILHGP